MRLFKRKDKEQLRLQEAVLWAAQDYEKEWYKDHPAPNDLMRRMTQNRLIETTKALKDYEFKKYVEVSI